MLLIDASVYIFRAFHALPSSIKGHDGQPLNALHGYADCLFIEAAEYRVVSRVAVIGMIAAIPVQQTSRRIKIHIIIRVDIVIESATHGKEGQLTWLTSPPLRVLGAIKIHNALDASARFGTNAGRCRN